MPEHCSLLILIVSIWLWTNKLVVVSNRVDVIQAAQNWNNTTGCCWDDQAAGNWPTHQRLHFIENCYFSYDFILLHCITLSARSAAANCYQKCGNKKKTICYFVCIQQRGARFNWEYPGIICVVVVVVARTINGMWFSIHVLFICVWIIIHTFWLSSFELRRANRVRLPFLPV